MVGLEVDRASLGHANTIISKNPILENLILRYRSNRLKILQGVIQKEDCFDAVIYNPSFSGVPMKQRELI